MAPARIRISLEEEQAGERAAWQPAPAPGGVRANGIGRLEHNCLGSDPGALGPIVGKHD
jgi:hypothetical protein